MKGFNDRNISMRKMKIRLYYKENKLRRIQEERSMKGYLPCIPKTLSSWDMFVIIIFKEAILLKI